ncbi:ABC-2 type transport system ATP-binding protein [Ferrithrix thermotolerans DSM 19514]|uniref:ABC-2 type transport system ATP-binding protein n=1 Tax=Ferrithrix thermotolerans DSM 19514 TaxID=1121881 RepID=A0A1M4S5K7_9ACTN|nr:ABC transporter ATP-binding protein [Ferrithrix thermotolerans]SHE27494.1 ABC-2 type transport system ATP-binding protein [Ferrithrix thermotolerans DSM 19514]
MSISIDLLVAESLYQSYADKVVLDGLSLNVEAGEIHGLLGANGAGKTTTLNILAGLVPPKSGNVYVCGKAVWPRPESIKALVGFVADEPIFIPNLSAFEHASLFARCFGFGRASKDRAEEVLSLVGLLETKDSRVEELSRGMKKRLALALALVARPKVLLLDEPTVGLDPMWIRKVKDLLCKFKEEGLAIVFSSHLLELVESVVDRVTVLKAGRVIGSGILDDLRDQASVDEKADLERVFFALTDPEDVPTGD